MANIELRYSLAEIKKELNKYMNYTLEMKNSVCDAAFHLHPNIPPAEPYFVMARQIGFKIPDKWQDMYKDKSNESG